MSGNVGISVIGDGLVEWWAVLVAMGWVNGELTSISHKGEMWGGRQEGGRDNWLFGTSIKGRKVNND